ncbi:DUF1015 domain-containing protein [Pedobacter cryophilus]|uniref:DUF1015 domain-containing protein n=1 Tax=Pedobacter cryophilus TaxID=2571271 RepID=A0A4V5NYZ0_9SPHI|nr:DUF1015 family protein [Pedobacter cryophilus]TKB97747.1 DUF1015 domain-containing protein [Pedobacter cryophilus]
MPKIKPFRAVLPIPLLVNEVVVDLENLTIENAKLIRNSNKNSFVHLLIPKLENYYLQGSKQELTFKKIAENFEDFIGKEILIRDKIPSIYVYRQEKNGHSYIGIWTVSSIDDYLNNKIKKHELTRPEREKGLIEYLQQTGIDANPVLITYPGNTAIDQLILDITFNHPASDFHLNDERHQVWKVVDENQLDILVAHFVVMKSSYIADGHHRAAAASTFGIERRKLNLKHHGEEEYNFFSSVYINSNQLAILPFHRFLKLSEEINIESVLHFLRLEFDLTEIQKEDLIPEIAHQFGLYIAGKSYMISIHKQLNNNVLNDLDVSLLQDYILEPLFNIINPREDKRLHFIGGKIDLAAHVKMIDDGIFDLAFFLFPTSISDLMKIADIGESMPPKSTWFEPKFPAGLIIHEID